MSSRRPARSAWRPHAGSGERQPRGDGGPSARSATYLGLRTRWRLRRQRPRGRPNLRLRTRGRDSVGTRSDIAGGLTGEQLVAAGTPHRRVCIEATPGSGKTTVAAQRLGIQRFHGGDQRAVLAVSFTRSATAELRDRVLRQWGPDVLAWPHRSVTLDTVVCDLLGYLLDRGRICWPSGHRSLTVIDSSVVGDPWQALYGFRGARPDLVPELVRDEFSCPSARRWESADPWSHGSPG
ncbi:UvrD-helicase domain-containing protein [Streptomyces sp. RM99]|uniref:UvrD-helicase domain-containing protein n=1 Tax=Streptomyces TaxID=1883 RepID=UPI0034D4D508